MLPKIFFKALADSVAAGGPAVGKLVRGGFSHRHLIANVSMLSLTRTTTCISTAVGCLEEAAHRITSHKNDWQNLWSESQTMHFGWRLVLVGDPVVEVPLHVWQAHGMESWNFLQLYRASAFFVRLPNLDSIVFMQVDVRTGDWNLFSVGFFDL